SLSCDHFFYLLIFLYPPHSPLFPYTTLFRSWWSKSSTEGSDQPPPARLDSGPMATASTEPAISISGLRKSYGANEVVRGLSLERSEEHTSELQSRFDLVCRLLLEKKKILCQS